MLYHGPIVNISATTALSRKNFNLRVEKKSTIIFKLKICNSNHFSQRESRSKFFVPKLFFIKKFSFLNNLCPSEARGVVVVPKETQKTR